MNSTATPTKPTALARCRAAQQATTPWGLHLVSMEALFDHLSPYPVLFVRPESEENAVAMSAYVCSALVLRGWSIDGEERELRAIHPWAHAEVNLPFTSVYVPVRDVGGSDVEAAAFEVFKTFNFVADVAKTWAPAIDPLAARLMIQNEGWRAVPGVRPARGSIGRAAAECE